MTGQTDAAAERSYHAPAAETDPLSVVEIAPGVWRARYAVEADAEIERLKQEVERLLAALDQAYEAGFSASAEGWNGEYPCDVRDKPTYIQEKAQALSRLAEQPRARPLCGPPDGLGAASAPGVPAGATPRSAGFLGASVE